MIAAFLLEGVDEDVEVAVDPVPALVFAGLVPVVVAAVFAGVDAAGVFVPPLEPEAVPFKQLVLEPATTVNAADCALSPLESRRVKPRLVPAAKFTALQMNGEPVMLTKVAKGVPSGVAPG